MAALEFAIIAPVAVLFVLGVYDISMAVIVRQEVQNAAHMIPISASNLAVQPDKSTSLTVAQVQQALSGIFAEIPGRRNGTQNGTTSATMSSVTFTQVKASCVSTSEKTCAMAPHVAWSVAYADPPGRYAGNANTFVNTTRPCGQLSQTTPTAYVPGNLKALPTASVGSPDPIIVVDIHYRYSPLLAVYLTGPIDFWASGYWSVRTVMLGSTSGDQYTRYDIANEKGGAGKCEGYS